MPRLTEQDHIERRGGIGGSDAPKIMKGDWLDLWMVKTGRKEDDNLSDVFQVQLGHATEAFNLEWLFSHHPELHRLDLNTSRSIFSSSHSFMQCRPDALALRGHEHIVIDAKHTNAFNDPATVYNTYYWQLVHNAHVVQCERAMLSVIYGNSWQDPIEFEVLPKEVTRLVEMEDQFWWHVTNDVRPESFIAMGTDDPAVPYDDMIEKDMSDSNAWATHAGLYTENAEAAVTFETAKKELKNLVEPNVRRAHGHGVEIKRAKNGSLRFS
jgi:hypothetical protein